MTTKRWLGKTNDMNEESNWEQLDGKPREPAKECSLAWIPMDYRTLLKKYIAHAAAAEGSNFALDVNLAPCGMLDMEFSESERMALNEVFGEVRKWEEGLPKSSASTDSETTDSI